jgi:hypothetical protein
MEWKMNIWDTLQKCNFWPPKSTVSTLTLYVHLFDISVIKCYSHIMLCFV